MHAMPPMPLLKRVQPSVWVALAWAAGAVFTFLIRFRLPGEEVPGVVAGVVFFRWDGLIMLAVATCMVVAGARRVSGRPLWSMVLLLGASVLGTTPLSVGEIPLAQFLAVDVALFFIASAQPRRTGLVTLAMALGTLVGYLSVRVLSGWNVGTSAEMAVAMTAVIAWLIGNSTHQAREYAERSRAQAAAQAVTAERLRIAREMHDTVAHSMGIIALQAGAAARVIETQPVAAREALSSIEAAGRETLAGLRRMLGALRQAEPEGAGAAEHPAAAEPRRPTGSRRPPNARVGPRTPRRSIPRSVSPTSTGWPRRRPPPGSVSRCGGSANRARSHRRSTSRRTASSRKRSPTSYGTRAPPPAASPSTAGPTRCPSRSRTTGTAADGAVRAPVGAWSGCASARRCWTVTSPQGRAPRAASG